MSVPSRADRRGRRARPAHAKVRERTHLPLWQVVVRGSEGEKQRERTHGLGAESAETARTNPRPRTKRRKPLNEPTEPSTSGGKRSNEAIRPPRCGAQPARIVIDGEFALFVPARSTHHTAHNRLDSTCAGCSGNYGSPIRRKEARTARRERGIRREDSSGSPGCNEFAVAGVFVAQGRLGERSRHRRFGAIDPRRSCPG